MKIGESSHCAQCGGRIMLVRHPSLGLNKGLWVHTGLVRRSLSRHAAVGALA